MAWKISLLLEPHWRPSAVRVSRVWAARSQPLK